MLIFDKKTGRIEKETILYRQRGIIEPKEYIKKETKKKEYKISMVSGVMTNTEALVKISKETEASRLLIILQYIISTNNALIINNKPATATSISEKFFINPAKIRKELAKLSEKEIIKRIKTTWYVDPYVMCKDGKVTEEIYELFENSNYKIHEMEILRGE